MGKVFISDEGNNGYTARVTSGSKLKVEGGASRHQKMASAASSASVVISSTACYLKSIIVGGLPASASSLCVYDTSGTAASANNVSGANTIGYVFIPALAAAATAQTHTFVYPFDVYCTSGLTIGLGQDGQSGNMNNVTVIYQA
jgi:hypothetical protein